MSTLPLQNLVSEIILAIKAKQAPRQAVHGLLIPEDSTWLIDEYAPGFGASLGAGYQRAAARLEQGCFRGRETVAFCSHTTGWRPG
jgi:hypothetical protein